MCLNLLCLFSRLCLNLILSGHIFLFQRVRLIVCLCCLFHLVCIVVLELLNYHLVYRLCYYHLYCYCRQCCLRCRRFRFRHCLDLDHFRFRCRRCLDLHCLLNLYHYKLYFRCYLLLLCHLVRRLYHRPNRYLSWLKFLLLHLANLHLLLHLLLVCCFDLCFLFGCCHLAGLFVFRY